MSTLPRQQLVRLFDLAVEAREERYGCVRLRRFPVAAPDGGTRALIEKNYEARMGDLQQRELQILVDVMNGRPSATGEPLYHRVASAVKVEAEGSLSADRTVRLLMKWHGFDLRDWRKLMQPGNGNFMQDAACLLDITRSLLRALELLHSIGWVHGDVTEENTCLMWTGELDVQADAIRGHVAPDKLMLVDLAMALRAPGERRPAPNVGAAKLNEFAIKQDGDAWNRLSPTQKEAYRERPHGLVAALDAAYAGDFKLFEALDYRIDLWCVGRMLEKWSAGDIAGRKPHIRLLDRLAKDMRSGDYPSEEDRAFCSLSGELEGPPPRQLPHAHWIAEIEQAIGPPGQYAFTVEYESSGQGRDKAPPTYSGPSRRKVAAIAAAAATAALAVGLVALRPQTQEPQAATGEPAALRTAAAASTARPLASLASKELYAALQDAARGQPVALAFEGDSFRIGQEIPFVLKTPRAGYWSILVADKPDAWPTVLYPNTPIGAGESFRLPTRDFRSFVAKEPAGAMQLLAVVTDAQVAWSDELRRDELAAALKRVVAVSAPVRLTVRANASDATPASPRKE